MRPTDCLDCAAPIEQSRTGVRRRCVRCSTERWKQQRVDWRAAHPEKRKAEWACENKKRSLDPVARTQAVQRVAEWRKKHPGMRTDRSLRRKTFTPLELRVKSGQWKARLEEFNHHCAYCLRPMGKLQKEHMIPLAKGGLHTIANLIPACARCNNKKSTRSLLEFVKYLPELQGCAEKA